MLFKLQNIPQMKDEPQRVWYKDGDLQLIVWFSEDSDIISFQLCYSCDFEEYTFIWHFERGFSHTIIEDERDILSYSYPIFLTNSHADIAELIISFDERSIEIEEEVSNFIHNKLMEYQGIKDAL